MVAKTPPKHNPFPPSETEEKTKILDPKPNDVAHRFSYRYTALLDDMLACCYAERAMTTLDFDPPP